MIEAECQTLPFKLNSALNPVLNRLDLKQNIIHNIKWSTVYPKCQSYTKTYY